MRFLISLIIIIILFDLTEKLLRKCLRIEKQKLSETSGKNVSRWVRGTLLLIFLCSIPFFYTGELEAIKWYCIFYLTLVASLRSFLEWKYLKNSKEYMITLTFLVLGLIVVYNMDYFI